MQLKNKVTMELFQQIQREITSRFQKLPRGMRAATVVLILIGVVALACLWNPQGEENRVPLPPTANVPKSQLAAYEMAFAEAELDEYTINQNQITVPQSQKSRYMAVLKKADLLPSQSGQVMVDAINASNPFESKKQREDRIKNARERQLGNMISIFPGIDEATVQYDAEKTSGLRPRTIYTASVTVRASNDKQLHPKQSQIICEFLAASIAGLEKDKIYIVDLNPSPGHATGTTGNGPEKLPTVVPLVKQAKSSKRENPNVSSWILIFLGCVVLAGCLAIWQQQRSETIKSLKRSSTAPPEATDQVEPQSSTSFQIDLAAELANTPANDSFINGNLEEPNRNLVVPGERDINHLIPHRQTAGVELTEITAEELVHANRSAKNPTADGDDLPSFDFLSKVDSDTLHQLLVTENAQIIAIVFSHLEPSQAAAVLSCLPEPLQVEILTRLSDLDTLSPDVLNEIEQSLEKRLTAQILKNSKRSAGVKAVGDLLDFVSPDAQTSIIKGLKGQNNALADQLLTGCPKIKPKKQSTRKTREKQSSKPTTRFDDLIYLDGKTLCKILNAVDQRDAILTLSSLDRQVVQRVTNNMKPDEADRLKKALDEIEPAQSSEITASRTSVVKMAERLCQCGRIQLNSSSPSGVSV